MLKSAQLDKEGCEKDQIIQSFLDADEKVLMSTSLWKFSQIGKQQKRILVITDKNIFNVTPKSSLANIISKVVKKMRVKRKIPISALAGITISKLGYEFILHVPDEYDYRYSSLDFRDKILEILAETYCNLAQRKLAFYISEEFILTPFCTTKIDKKKQVSRMPRLEPIFLDGSDLKQHDFGRFQSNINYSKKDLVQCSVDLNNFTLLKLIGKGQLAHIYLCEEKETKILYAMKAITKMDMITKDYFFHVKTERKILQEFRHPFLIYINFAFHDQERGGDLFYHLKQETRFKEDRVKFYAAQIALALGYIHEKEYVYRELKPENILLDNEGYIVLTDFGSAKLLLSEKNYMTNSFIGTPDYIAPEIVQKTSSDPNVVAQAQHNEMVDWWALGIVIYEMLVGITPFFNENQNIMFEAILQKEVKFPQSLAISQEAKDIINLLLKKVPKERLGSKKDFDEVKTHPWFSNISFKELQKRKVMSIFTPKITSPQDISNFDDEFTNEPPLMVEAENTDLSLLKKFTDEFSYINYDPTKKQ